MNVLILSGAESHIEINSFHYSLRSAFLKFNNHFYEINNRYLDNTDFNEYQPFQTPSLNSVILGASLEEIGVPYDILTGLLLDSSSGMSQLDEMLYKKDYGVIAISTTLLLTPDFVKKLVLHIKKIQNECIIVVGGPLLFNNKSIIDINSIDYFIYGDGEDIFPKLITEIIKGNKESQFDGVFGWKDNIRYGNSNCLLVDINKQKIPDWEKYLLSHKVKKKNILPENTVFQLLIETTRGCPFNCAYCNYHNYGSKVRYKNANRICVEIDKLYRLGIRKIGFWDTSFTYPPNRLNELLNMIEKRKYKNLYFSGFATLHSINDELLKRMSTLGFRELFIGLESGNNSILKAMNKRITREEIIDKFEKFSLIKDINFICSFIVGYPGENYETIEDTIDLIKNIKVKYIELSPLQILRGSELFHNPQRYGLKYILSESNDLVESWEHLTMNSDQALENTLKIYDRISVETDSLVIAPLLHVTSLAQKYNPLKSNSNFRFLKMIQKGISLSRINSISELTKVCLEIESKYKHKIHSN